MDLSTRYLGFELPHPFMNGASPLAENLDRVRRLEDAGSAAIVMNSLFEEQIARESLATSRSMDAHGESFAEAMSYFPSPDQFVLGPEEYLEQIRRIKAAVRIPVIASLNGTTVGGWLSYARQIQQAGADALELNIYYIPTDPEETGDAVVARTVEMVAEVRKAVTIPLAVKLSPYYTSIANVAKRLVQAGARGLVLFNRFYQPDIDVEELEVVQTLNLSDSHALPPRLRALATLSGRIQADLAVTGGVHTPMDGLKAVMCGANAVQMVAALLIHGTAQLTQVRNEVARWLEEHEYESLRQAQGSMSLNNCPDPSAFERANYMHILRSWEGSAHL